MIELLIGLLLLLALALLALVGIDRRREQRLRERLADRILDTATDEDDSLWRDAADLLQVARMQALLAQSPVMRRLSEALIRGNVALGFGQVLSLLLGLAGAGAGLGYGLGRHLGFGLAGGLVLPLLLWVGLMLRAERRIARRERQLPSFCTQMLSALRTGSTPLSALQAAARTAPEPLGRSLRELIDALQLGVQPATAWRDWAQRCGGDHARVLATGIRLKWEAGGQMSSMLEHILESMVARERMLLRVGTLTAQAKMGSYVLSLLPLAFMLFSWKVNPRIFDFMLADPIGRAALWIGAGLVVTGFLWLQRLARLSF